MPILNPKKPTPMTGWGNRTKQTARFSIYLGPPDPPLPGARRFPPMTAIELEDSEGAVNVDVVSRQSKPKTIDVVLAPGEEIDLPSEYDRAIQALDAHGLIVGGLAPWLTRIAKPAMLHPALVPSKLPPPVQGVSLDQLIDRLGGGATAEIDAGIHVASRVADEVEADAADARVVDIVRAKKAKGA